MNKSIIKIMQESGLLKVLQDSKRGVPPPSEFRQEIPERYYPLIWELYLQNRTNDEKVFNDGNSLDLPDSFIRKHAPEIAFLLEDEKSSNLARRVLKNLLYTGDYNEKTYPLYLKLFKSVASTNDQFNVVEMLERFLNNIDFHKLLKTPKMIGELLRVFYSYRNDYYQDFRGIGRDLIQLLYATKTKNNSIWKKMFPYFIKFCHYSPNNSDVLKALDTFLDANTGLDEDLKDQINLSFQDGMDSSRLDDVWFKYHGVPLIRKGLSQVKAMRKARRMAKAIEEPTTTPKTDERKFEVGDIVVLDNNDYNLGEVIKVVNPEEKAWDWVVYTVEFIDETILDLYGDRLTMAKNLPKFGKGQYVEDVDGNVYRVLEYEDGMVRVRDRWSDYYRLNEDDLMPFDISKMKFQVGETVRVNYGYRSGETGKITNYNPFDEPPQYYIKSMDRWYSESGIDPIENPKSAKESSDETDALGDHGFKGATHDFNVGDVIIANYDAGPSKYVITGITNDERYEYKCYNTKLNGDWDDGFDSSFNIKSFDKHIKEMNGTKVNDSSADTQPENQKPPNKYSDGDTFLSVSGKYKTVVKSYNKDNDTYHVAYYDKNNGIDWKIYYNDTSVGRALFEDDIEQDIENKTWFHDIKI